MQRERPRKGVDRRRISKLLSLILRHRPDEFGLNMDEYGYIPLDEVTEAVQQRYSEVGEEDIRRLVDDSKPKRFEIVDDYIRALYGHSFYLEIDDDPIDPPEKLFMGTTANAGRRVPEEGLRPIDRSYLHLSMTREIAESAATRRGNRASSKSRPSGLSKRAVSSSTPGGRWFFLGKYPRNSWGR
jgi:putative RNA 2'-phosphotransferase